MSAVKGTRCEYCGSRDFASHLDFCPMSSSNVDAESNPFSPIGKALASKALTEVLTQLQRRLSKEVTSEESMVED
jgi:hypothetical protein